jgi:hypothetical protein
VLGRPRIVAAGHGWIVFACKVLVFVLSFLGLAWGKATALSCLPAGRPESGA